MRRSACTRVVVKLQAVRCPRAVQYRPRLKYRMMQYKGELEFSLDCIASFLVEYLSAESWAGGARHKELLLVPLLPKVIARRPHPWAGLPVAVSRTFLQIDK